MKLSLLAMSVALAGLVPTPRLLAAPQAGADSILAPAPRSLPSPGFDRFSLRSAFLRDRIDAPATIGYLTLSLDMSAYQWYEPLTRFEAITHGAGAGATLGMFIGAVGNTLAWFDEDTTWLITGSLAAACALHAAAHYEPRPVLRVDLSGDRRH